MYPAHHRQERHLLRRVVHQHFGGEKRQEGHGCQVERRQGVARAAGHVVHHQVFLHGHDNASWVLPIASSTASPPPVLRADDVQHSTPYWSSPACGSGQAS